MARVLSGRVVRDSVAKDLKKQISKVRLKPHLAIIQIGDRSESNAYIKQKKIFGERIGARVTHLRLPENIKEAILLSKIKKLNSDRDFHGIIVQMPFPKHIDKEKVLEAISPLKDVDGLHSQSVKKVWQGNNDGYLAATAKGILTLLKYYKIALIGRKVIMVGSSILVGKPTAMAILNEKATVTIAHKYSRNLPSLTKEADIIIVATGVPNLIKARNVKKGQVVIDVGITVVGSKIVGDVDFAPVSKIVKAISPVPGGVGPMTVASLFLNLWSAYKTLKK